ncbi:MAG TPA: methyltransferase domain-containing protein [Verrucomicrobiae bacterium]|nr:methyltransferase domain-containing protein [Verrucomicrobiae bacterium]
MEIAPAHTGDLSTMGDWKPSSEYQRVAEANRRFYSQVASLYDASETCVTDARMQKQLEADLDKIIGILGRQPAAIRTLDACGGSGNVAFKLLARGLDVTLVDISSKLLDIFSNKCAAAGVVPRSVCSEIGSYMSQSSRKFDLIVFSSALHHLENIESVLTLAFHCLVPGGLLFTIYDPTSRDRLRVTTRVLQRLEYFTFKVFCQTQDLPAAFFRRLRRLFSGVSARRKSDVALSQATAGLLAEFHVGRGIDDLALVSKLRAVGFDVIWHERYAESRFDLTRRIIERIGDSTSFKLLLHKPCEVELTSLNP